MRRTIQDIRYAARILSHNWRFSIAVIGTLAIGIAATTVMFTVIRSVLLRPVPFPDSERLVAIRENAGGVSLLDLEDLERRSASMEGIAAFYLKDAIVQQGSASALVSTAIVSTNLPDVLQVQPSLGRQFTREDGRMGAGLVAIVSAAFWRDNLSSNPEILGQELRIDQQAYTVIGVMPPSFEFPPDTKVWIALQPTGQMQQKRDLRTLQVIGRMNPGVTIEKAQAELDTIMSGLAQEYPGTDGNITTRLVRYRETITGSVRVALMTLLAAVAILLFISVSNTINLQLAFMNNRVEEFALRYALGAEGWRILQQIVTENLLLSTVSGIVGIIVAWILTHLLRKLPIELLPRASEIRLDIPIFLVFAILVVACGFVAGIVPALPMLKNCQKSLANGVTRGTTAGHSRYRVQRILLASEVALTVILLGVSGLLLRTVHKLLHVDLGFETNHVIAIEMVPIRSFSMEMTGHGNSQVVDYGRTLYSPIVRKLETWPGIKAVGLTSVLPLTSVGAQTTFFILNRPKENSEPEAELRIVSSGYFRALSIPLLEGRLLSDDDSNENAPVAVVNRAFARKFFHSEDPLGKQVDIEVRGQKPFTIVGVVRSTVQSDLSQKPNPEIDVPYLEMHPENSIYSLLFGSQINFVFSTNLNLRSTADAVRAMLIRDAAGLTIVKVSTMEQLISGSVYGREFGLFLVASFSILAFVLAIIGLYGVTSYVTARRQREVGVRLALGADRPAIVMLLLRQSAAVIGLGIAIGMICTITLGRLISGFLYGIKPTDLLTLISASALMAIIGVLATFIPAAKAARMDTANALRAE